jgi:prepilin-type N-terminal cleavage/methylation domain-containing protein
MILQNIKSNRKDSGFTIVELLVVIVVIGILATITIVSYAGVTARANAAKALSNAQAIVSVAEAINADNSKYPVTTAEFGSLTSTARVPSSTVIQVGAPTTTNGTTNFQLFTLTTNPSTGGRVMFWDYAKANLCNVITGNANGSTVDTCVFWGAATSGSAFTVFAS